MLPIFMHAVILLDVRDQIIKQILFKRRKGLYLKAVENIACRPVILHSPAVRHHHDHRRQFSLRVQVVEYYRNVGAIEPFFLITTDTMKEV